MRPHPAGSLGLFGRACGHAIIGTVTTFAFGNAGEFRLGATSIIEVIAELL